MLVLAAGRVLGPASVDGAALARRGPILPFDRGPALVWPGLVQVDTLRAATTRSVGSAGGWKPCAFVVQCCARLLSQPTAFPIGSRYNWMVPCLLPVIQPLILPCR